MKKILLPLLASALIYQVNSCLGTNTERNQQDSLPVKLRPDTTILPKSDTLTWIFNIIDRDGNNLEFKKMVNILLKADSARLKLEAYKW